VPFPKEGINPFVQRILPVIDGRLFKRIAFPLCQRYEPPFSLLLECGGRSRFVESLCGIDASLIQPLSRFPLRVSTLSEDSEGHYFPLRSQLARNIFPIPNVSWLVRQPFL